MTNMICWFFSVLVLATVYCNGAILRQNDIQGQYQSRTLPRAPFQASEGSNHDSPQSRCIHHLNELNGVGPETLSKLGAGFGDQAKPYIDDCMTATYQCFRMDDKLSSITSESHEAWKVVPERSSAFPSTKPFNTIQNLKLCDNMMQDVLSYILIWGKTSPTGMMRYRIPGVMKTENKMKKSNQSPNNKNSEDFLKKEDVSSENAPFDVKDDVSDIPKEAYLSSNLRTGARSNSKQSGRQLSKGHATQVETKKEVAVEQQAMAYTSSSETSSTTPLGVKFDDLIRGTDGSRGRDKRLPMSDPILLRYKVKAQEARRLWRLLSVLYKKQNRIN